MHAALMALPLLARLFAFSHVVDAPLTRSAATPRIGAHLMPASVMWQGGSCPVGQAASGNNCINLPVGAAAAGCPSGVANGTGGCAAPASGQSSTATAPPARPPTSLQNLGAKQVPWTVSIRPATNYVAIGQCLAVYIDLFDPVTKDIPRNPKGWRVSMADFDWTASGNAAVGKYDGPNAWAVCACPAAAVGSTIHVMATYPAASMIEAAKVPQLAFQSYIELPITKPFGTNSPAGCDNALVTTTVATSVPGGAAGGGVGAGGAPGGGSLQAGGAPGAGSPPAIGGAAGGAPGAIASAGGGASGGVAGGAPPTALPAGKPPVVGAPIAVAPGTGRQPGAVVPALVPVNPKNFSAVQTGDGAVTLQWEAVPGVAFYQLWGAGLPNTGVTITSGTTQTVTGVQSGTQAWSIGSFYLPGPVSTSASDFTKTQLLVTQTVASGAPPPSGTAYPPGGGTAAPPPNAPPPTNAAATNRYRVVATGFRVLHQTKDDFLSRDGHGDEVYGGFMAFHYDRTTSKLVDQDLRRTNVIGERGLEGLAFGDRLFKGGGNLLDMATGVDTVVKYSRVQGGTASQGGGFAQNDVFPAVGDPSQTYGVAPTNNSFPFLVWQGALTDAKDAVVILPSLWEFDGFPDGFNKWHQSEQANVIQIWSDPAVQAAVAGTQLALISPSGTLETSFGLHMTAGGIFELAFVGLGPIALLTAGSYDRPIGVGMHGIGTGGIASGPVLPRRAIVITREIIEATLARLASYNPAGSAPGVFPVFGGPPVVLPAPPPGTIAVQLFESPADDLQGMYILYLKVERLP